MHRLLKVCLSFSFLFAGLAALTGCNGARDTALNMVGQNGDKGFNIKTLARGDRSRKYADVPDLLDPVCPAATPPRYDGIASGHLGLACFCRNLYFRRRDLVGQHRAQAASSFIRPCKVGTER